MKSLVHPRIAVLLPSYNPGAELVGTLDSLRKQSVPFRLFLVDDGSKYPADYEALTHGMDCHVMRLPQNLGITGAMNAGLDQIMRGNFDYIARIDTGDFCAPDRFAIQLAYMDAHHDIGIVGSAVEFRLFNAENTLVGAKVMIFPLTVEGCAKRLALNSPIIHPAMLIRRSVFETLKAYSENYPAAEDFDLLWRTHKAGFKLINLTETLLIKEETPDSISQKRRRKQILSRLRIQWDNRDLTNPRCWLGLAKSLVTWVMPAWAVHSLKFMIGR
jgi:glycosyltransferase involved in cell wall biosynthesis